MSRLSVAVATGAALLLAGAAWLWLRYGAAVFLGGGTMLC